VHVQRLLGRLKVSDGSDTAIDIAVLLLKLSTDFATQTVFGHSTDSLLRDMKHWSGEQDKGSAGEFSTALAHALYMLGQRGQLLNFYWLRDSLQFRRSCRRCRAFVNKYLAESLSQEPEASKESGKTATSFMHSLVAKENVPTSVIGDQLLSLLFASRDTTASFASWVIYALLKHPRVMAKLRGVIETHLSHGELPTMADISALVYLRHVLNETMRIFPGGPHERQNRES
jgi:cytochrome P450